MATSGWHPGSKEGRGFRGNCGFSGSFLEDKTLLPQEKDCFLFLWRKGQCAKAIRRIRCIREIRVPLERGCQA